MLRFMFKDIDSLNALALIRWCCRIAFSFGFGCVFAVVMIFARWSHVTQQQDVNAQYTAIRLQAENDQLREAIATMQRTMKPVKQNTSRNIGGE